MEYWGSFVRDGAPTDRTSGVVWPPYRSPKEGPHLYLASGAPQVGGTPHSTISVSTN